MLLKNIKDLTLEELTEYFKGISQPAFKAKQCFKWLSAGVTDFSEMTDISKDLRKTLADDFFISVPEISRKQVSKDKTVKYLFKNTDGTYIETVVMTYKHGISACLSTQVGCNMGCKFCASTIGGKERNLTAGEILDQIIFASKDMGQRISHVVLMGMGEPLDNYDEVIHFLKNVTNPLGLNLSYRHISLSTCGLVPKIEMLMKEKMPITLSVSLHAPTDEKRNQIMPVNKKYNITMLMDSLKKYVDYTGRRISFEYTLIKGFNDSFEDAKKLAGLLKGMLAHVNLIPVNEVTETGFKKPENVNRFKNWLIDMNVNATVRRELGSDIDAACGQLRKKEMK
ncbi:MAG: 23S rRNA (adenine(2503)-C(2))-methyltransferase RlmN [Ruminococcaceae bacterium]|nr:23S rRNA (adenine(2503)-C(2))-methyltransferase RlmN [Oscillospiraceae bacterium]